MGTPSHRRVRKIALLSGVAILAGLAAAPEASAQCRSTTPPVIFGFQPQAFFPLGQGGAVNSLVSVLNSVNTAFQTQTTAFVSAPGNPRPDQQGAGVWARGIGGSVDTDNTSTTKVGGIPGDITCDATTRTNFSGFQVGHDISILNGGATGANLHFGVTAGYVEADAKQRGGTFSGNFEVPFAGVYIAFTKGGFFADGQVRADFYQNEVSDSANGLFGQQFDGRGVAVTGNIGYNHQLGGGWFIEPSVGGVLSRVSLDPLNVSGTLILADSPGLAFPGTVQIHDIESALGRASLRIGTNFTAGQIAWQPFVTASVFHEFAGKVDTTTSSCLLAIVGASVCGVPGLDFTANTATSRVGTYGQYAIGTAAAIINTGWLGYARFDYRSGENIEGWSVNAGLRYQFTPDRSQAGLKDAPIPVEYYNWTGLYAGGFAGMTWGDEHWLTSIINTRDNPRFAGYLAGGQIGYNVQAGKVVFGVEADYGWANAKGAKSCTGGASPFFFTCEAELEKLTTVTARVGHTWGRSLFYVKGGMAAGEVTVQTSTNTQLHPLIFTGTPLLVPPVNGETKWQLGWTVGAGMEFALTNHWSAKAEYMYYDLGKDNYRIDQPLVADADVQGSTVRIGVNYHFQPRVEATAFK